MTIVLNLVKRGHYNKWFDRQAARRTNMLYRENFGLGVTRGCVRKRNITHVIWVETEAKDSLAAMMLSKEAVGDQEIYRVQGLAVSADQQRQGYGTALMQSLDRMLLKGAIVWLCVDVGKDSTEWLVQWYRRLGFELAYCDARLKYLDDEIPMKRVIGSQEKGHSN